MGLFIELPIIPGVYLVSVLPERVEKCRFGLYDKCHSPSLVELRIVPQPDAFKGLYLTPYRAAGMSSHRIHEVPDQRHLVFDLFIGDVSYFLVEYLAICYGRYD